MLSYWLSPSSFGLQLNLTAIVVVNSINTGFQLSNSAVFKRFGFYLLVSESKSLRFLEWTTPFLQIALKMLIELRY